MREINEVKEFLWNQCECRINNNHEIEKKSLNEIFKIVSGCIKAFNELPIEERKLKMQNMKIIKDRFNEILEKESAIDSRVKNIYKSIFKIKELSVDLIRFSPDVKSDKKSFIEKTANRLSSQKKKKTNNVTLTKHDIEYRLCSLIASSIQRATKSQANSSKRIKDHDKRKYSVYKHFVISAIEDLTQSKEGHAISVEMIQHELLSKAQEQYGPIKEMFTEEDIIHAKDELELIELKHDQLKYYQSNYNPSIKIDLSEFSYIDYDQAILKKNIKLLNSQKRLNRDPSTDVYQYPMLHYRLGNSERDFTELLETIKTVMKKPTISVAVDEWNQERRPLRIHLKNS